MSLEFSKQRQFEFADEAMNQPNAQTASNERTQTTDEKHAPANNWAWTHRSSSYDWMDSYEGFSSTEWSD
jgi:hypothetical protein